jgi:ubiquinone biosynthesis monooxygenase Coq7
MFASFVDRFIIALDGGLKTVFAPAHSARPFPSSGGDRSELSQADKDTSMRLMRVNHSGEICAQALYQGQALTARHAEVRQALETASREERDHLAWCEARIAELGGRKSVLNPMWYGASFALGAFSGLLGDKWNLGFLVETERQVEGHLSGHLERLPAADIRTRTLIEQMRRDEIGHAATGIDHGAAELPLPVKVAMKLSSKMMTRTSYWI